MTNKHNIKNFIESIDGMQLNCPLALQNLLRTIKDLKKEPGNCENVWHFSTVYKHITQESILYTNKIQENMETFKHLFEEKTEQAKTEGKNLLVILGEMHHYQTTLLAEMIITTILKANGFTSALIETSDELLTYINQNPANNLNLYFSFLAKVLEMELAPIDPLNNLGGLGEERSKEINNSIELQKGKDQVLIIGSSHIDHILSADNLKDYFTTLTINVGHSLAPNDKFLMNWDIGTSESFTLKTMIDIYADVMPDLLENSAIIKESYVSDFDKDPSECEYFNNIPLINHMVNLMYNNWNCHVDGEL